MDFTGGSVPPNQSSDSMPMPPFPLPHHSQEEKERLALEQFWHQQLSDVQGKEVKPQEFLPARIKRIMKANKNIKASISSEFAIVFAKLCEVFAQELMFRGWIHAQANNRHSVKPHDVIIAVNKDPIFNFLRNHHDPNKGEGNQPSVIHNTVVNLEGIIEKSMQQLVPAPPLPSDQMVQIDPYFPDQSQTMMMHPPYDYEPYDHYFPSNQIETMPPPNDQPEAMQPLYQPSYQTDTMQPPPDYYYPFPNDFQYPK